MGFFLEKTEASELHPSLIPERTFFKAGLKATVRLGTFFVECHCGVSICSPLVPVPLTFDLSEMTTFQPAHLSFTSFCRQIKLEIGFHIFVPYICPYICPKTQASKWTSSWKARKEEETGFKVSFCEYPAIVEEVKMSIEDEIEACTM